MQYKWTEADEHAWRAGVIAEANRASIGRPARPRRRRRNTPLPVRILIGIGIAAGVVLASLIVTVLIVDDFHTIGELVSYIVLHTRASFG